MDIEKEQQDPLFKQGLEIRKSVLGDDYVEKSIASADDLTEDLQRHVTRHCWGAIWSRPGLDKRTRSFLNLSMIAALNRPHELKLHIRGALNNGVTREEIREVFLQVGAYCGAPAAIDSFRLAREVFEEIDG
ncbi:MAG: carboxymuconolactone decarboxylase family protein [Hyphomicrobiaceae bacterium]|nr:carboxymuconolactone decarboxylase family protein [Hyphomicrobiaceae bacterium]